MSSQFTHRAALAAILASAGLCSGTEARPARAPQGVAIKCDSLPRMRNEAPRGLASGRSIQAIPLLDSRPSAVAQIFIDLDGAVVTDPLWNNGSTIVAPAYNLTAGEVQSIFDRVKEDYLPFNINITTDESKYLAAPVGKRMRVIVTPNNAAAPGAGGVAYLYSFAQAGNGFYSSDIPCWVFNSSVIGISEAVSHEVGHTLGLVHDGREVPGSGHEEYFLGHGSGVTSWAPIMGAGYYRNVSQWSKGEYEYANNQEDDVAIISGSGNGFGFAADEAGGDVASSVLLANNSGTVNQTGVISSAADADVYRFFSDGTPTVLNAVGAATGANLDIGLDILDGTGRVVASDHAPADLDAQLTVTLAAGTYFLRVKGDGAPNPPQTGYSTYGSMGAYTLSGNVAVGLNVVGQGISLTEGNSGRKNAGFLLSLSAASSKVVTVNYATVDGSAVAGQDYVATTGSISFNPGERQKTVNVAVNGDTVFEKNEIFLLRLTGATNAALITTDLSGAILNDDVAGTTFGRLVYASDRTGTSQIYIDDTRGNNPVQLTTDAAYKSSPALSRDGSKISYISNTSGTPQLWVMASDGSGQRQLTFLVNKTADAPAWGTDGNTIVFDLNGHTSGFETTDIAAIPATGGSVAMITSDGLCTGAAVSPDGTKVAYQYGPNPSQGVICVQTLADGSRQFVTDTGIYRHANWSPDGSQLVCSRLGSTGNFDIVLLDVAAGLESEVITTPSSEDNAVFSPSGTFIAFERAANGGSDIYTADATGGTESLAISPGNNTHPSWGALVSPPLAVSVLPTPVTTKQLAYTNFRTVYRDPSGVGNITLAYFQAKGSADTRGGIQGYYDVVANKFYLWDGARWIGGFAPGSNNRITVGQCTLNAANCGIAKKGTDLTINWNLAASALFSGTKSLILKVTNSKGLTHGPVTKGTWTITAATVAAPPVAPTAPSGNNS